VVALWDDLPQVRGQNASAYLRNNMISTMHGSAKLPNISEPHKTKKEAFVSDLASQLISLVLTYLAYP